MITSPASLSPVRPRGATPPAEVYLGPGVATVAEGEDAPDIRPILNTENLALWTGVRCSSWPHKQKAAALLFAFLAEYEVDVIRLPHAGRVRVGCAHPAGTGYLSADGESLEEAALALWRKRAAMSGRTA
jgi:hypothetical protein